MSEILRDFRAKHAEAIAATKAEFVKFLREGDLAEAEESLDLAATFIFISNRAMKHPVAAGNWFGSVVEDGVFFTLEDWENREKRTECPTCDGEGMLPKRRTARAAKVKAERSKVRI